jgi:thiosulfate dehydrogenase
MALLVLLLAAALAACQAEEPSPAVPTAPPAPPELELTGSVSAGGRLYDSWWTEAKVDEPAGDQPLWASQSTNTRSGTTTWRCKECHGWDYLGADGAYGSGSHATGFPGVFDSSSASDGELLAWLDGSANQDHDFSAMGDEALADLVTFLQDGVIETADVVMRGQDGDWRNVTEDGPFPATCVTCHGEDGRLLNFGSEDEPEYVGTIAVDNPWEFIHKVRAGQPATQMPSAIDQSLTLQEIVNLLAYAQTLPPKAAPPGSVSRGGQLYDEWWKVTGGAEPTEDNPVWARQSTNTREGSVTWRCKECHGWDYLGADGAYGSGSHATGFPGVYGAREKSFDELLAAVSGGVDPDHDYAAMGEASLADLVSFLLEGTLDVSGSIDPATKAPIGADPSHGLELYQATCLTCHGEDGRLLNFGGEAEPEYVGTIAVDNPGNSSTRSASVSRERDACMLDAGWSPQDARPAGPCAGFPPSDLLSRSSGQ